MTKDLVGGLAVMRQPVDLLILSSAVPIGFVGPLRGIGGVIRLPVTYTKEPTGAFTLLTAPCASSVVSRFIAAIQHRAPGMPEAVMTALDGCPSTQKSAACKARRVGMVGTVMLIVAPQSADIALRFYSPEFLALAVRDLPVVASPGGPPCSA